MPSSTEAWTSPASAAKRRGVARPVHGVQCKRADFPEDFVPTKNAIKKKLQVSMNCPLCTDGRIKKYNEEMDKAQDNPGAIEPTLELTEHDDYRFVIQYALSRRLQKLVPATAGDHHLLILKIFECPELLIPPLMICGGIEFVVTPT